MMNQRMRWVRWLAVWLTLIVILGVGLTALLGPFAPAHLPWSGAFVLASALTFMFVPSPIDGV